MKRLLLFALLLTPVLCGVERVVLKPLFPERNFIKPVAMVQHPTASRQWYIAEQDGRITEAEKREGGWHFRMIADLSERIESGPSEAGLLSIAFEPGFKTGRRVFLSYTREGKGFFSGAALVSVVSRFTLDDAGRLDPASERPLLTLEQPYSNHNGGHILFGPDGMLYIGFGDGGWAGDPDENAQNTANWFGTILRIDPGAKEPYAIPPDNPFAKGGGKPEIYAWGLRNPWRFSFDIATGTLWAGDVGQDAVEEIDRIEKGKNYGWDRKEGSRCYEKNPCDHPVLIDPVAQYGHEAGCSVTGGYVYRGKRLPFLRGYYLYGDFCSGTVWMLDTEHPSPPRILLRSGKSISSFAQGRDGEVYLIDYEKGRIFALSPGP